jgi:hypothetical protein
MFRGLVMDGHASLSLTPLSLISLRSCSLHLDPLFTAEHVLSRMVSLCHELFNNLGFDLYTVSMTLVGST